MPICNLDYFKINNDSTYYYWTDKTDLLKLENIKNNHKIPNGYYLPCICYDTFDYNSNNMIEKNILIFLKNPKILYGLTKINNIILNEIKKKNNLLNYDVEIDVEVDVNVNVDVDVNNLNELHINKFILVDTTLYQNLLNIFNLVNIPGLFFIKIDEINIFNYEINLNIFNKYFENTANFVKFKYPLNIKSKHIIKSYHTDFNNFKLNIINYLEYLEKNYNKKNDCNSKTINTNTNTNTYDKKTLKLDKSEIKFNIPILWNGCDEFKKIFFKHFKNNTLDKSIKKMFINHWCNCDDCEIIDNNKVSNCLNNEKFIKKKKIIKLIEVETDYNIFEKIINCYHNMDDFILNDINEKFQLDTKKINIISCYQKGNNYKKCIFIINK